MEGFAYCEHADCDVILYLWARSPNCPGCGLYGRLKDKPTEGDDDGGT